MIYDDVIMRTIIELPDEQAQALSVLCRDENISRAEAVRRGVALLLEKQHANGRDQAFGAWKKKKIDSRKFVASLRREWEK